MGVLCNCLVGALPCRGGGEGRLISCVAVNIKTMDPRIPTMPGHIRGAEGRLPFVHIASRQESKVL